MKKQASNRPARRRTNPDALRRERGNALLAIIGIIAVLAALGVAFQATVQSQSRTYDAFAARIAMQNAVDAAVGLGIWRVASAWRQESDELQGTAWRCTLNDKEVVLVIENESLRLNLNLADGGAIAAELQRVGVKPGEAAVLGGRIADFVDRDEVGFDGRPETDIYSAASMSGSSNRPVEIFDEIREIPGVSAEIFEIMMRELSIFSTRSDRVAAGSVNEGPEEVAPRGVYRISAYAPGAEGVAVAGRTAIIELYASRPFEPLMRAWSSPAQPRVAAPANGGDQPCRQLMLSN